jgi:tyrosine-protein phosphatase YwqE
MISKVLSLFRRKDDSYSKAHALTVDMHSHLLPAIDDGVQSYEQSINIIKDFVELGYQKIITTPHIMGDFYQNTPEIIMDRLDKLCDIVKQMQLPITIEAAAEYYLDESFMDRLANKEKLLCFGDKKYVLFETSYLNPSPFVNQAIFMMQTQGYKPVLAHPERYIYLFDNQDKVFELYEKGCLLQVNMTSLVGYYSKPSKMIAEKLINNKMVAFLGTDCHNEKHLEAIKDTFKNSSYFEKALKLDLLNNTLNNKL